MLLRVMYLGLGTVLMALCVASTELAAPLGYLALPVVAGLFLAGWWAYFRGSFPRQPAEPQNPVGDTAKLPELASSRALLFGALAVAALFAPVWAWIVPLFALQAAWRARATPGEFGDNFLTELRSSARFLTRSAANAAVFALSCLLALVAMLGTYGLLCLLR